MLGIAIDACISRRLLETSTLPILLLEDAVDALPLSVCEAAWGVFESHKDSLVDTLNSAQVRLCGVLAADSVETQYFVPLARSAAEVAQPTAAMHHVPHEAPLAGE